MIKKGILVLSIGILLLTQLLGCSKKEDYNKSYSDTRSNDAEYISKSPSGALYEFHMLDPYEEEAGWNTEEYSSITENSYKEVITSPVSTFSIDVDTASYSNVRRYINNGMYPPRDSVRLEEMINYFSYGYEAPTGDVPFSVRTEIGVCPWNPDNYVAMIGIKGKDIEKDLLPPSNLVFLVDVSGSMDTPNKLPLLKSSFKLLVDELEEKDIVSIAVYAGATGVVLEGARGNEKERIIEALDRLEAGGSTNGAGGIQLAYDLAKKHYLFEGNNRVILATDGDFNVGISSESELVKLIESKRNEGIFLSVLGYGMGNYKDNKMEKLADKGNGNYAYIDTLKEANKVLVEEMGATLFTIAKDVKIQVEFNPSKVKSYRLIGYENRVLNNEDFDDDTKDAGELGAGHTVTALYEIEPMDPEEIENITGTLKYQNFKLDENEAWQDEWFEVRLRYKDPKGDESKKIIQPVRDSHFHQVVSSDFNFALAVAEFALILRDSEYKGNASLEQVLSLARSNIGNDVGGYRQEFVELVKKYSNMKP